MASRPLAFGVRYSDKGRTVRVRQSKKGGSGRYVLEVDRRGGRRERREHGSLGDALRDFASAWRSRLH